MLRVHWTKPARRKLRRLDAVTRARIEAAVALFASDGIGDARPLAGDLSGYRLRVGGWRVLFDLDAYARLMTVQAVRPRGDAYR